MMKVEAILGHKGDRPLRPFVQLDSSDDGDDTWLSPAQARRFARKLLKAADDAESKFRIQVTK